LLLERLLALEQPAVLIREILELVLHRLELAPERFYLLLLARRRVRKRRPSATHERAQRGRAHRISNRAWRGLHRLIPCVVLDVLEALEAMGWHCAGTL
jgi:hypothetical protein